MEVTNIQSLKDLTLNKLPEILNDKVLAESGNGSVKHCVYDPVYVRNNHTNFA